MSTHPQERLKEAIIEETRAFEEVYLWLEDAMPKVFFQEVSKEWISLIVHTLMGFQKQDYFAEIHLKNAAISLCVDSPKADVEILKSYPLFGIKNYTTYISRLPLPYKEISGYLRIATIYFTEAIKKVEEPLSIETREELAGFLQARNVDWGKEKCSNLFEEMDPRFLRKMPRESQVIALEMFERAQTRDHCQYEVQYEEEWESKGISSMSIVMAWKNVPKHNFLHRLARVVYRHGLVMRRVNAAYLNPYQTNSIFMLTFGIHGAKGGAAWEAADIVDFLQELVTLKYFGSLDLIDETFIQTRLLNGNLGNLLRSMTSFINQVLVQVDPNLYSLENIEEAFCRHPELAIKLCNAFEHKFHPTRHDIVVYEKERDEFLQLVDKLDTGHEYHDIRRKNILYQGMNFVTHVLKTNFYRNNKTAFAFRLDPQYLDCAPFERSKVFPELPFGIFYMKGMHFIGFHIRFKDLSRGGLRTIYPKKKERMLAERNTVFHECYNLAYTQHKKNKDIPEGGAKGVIFLKPYERLTSEAEIFAKEMELAGFSSDEIHQKIETFKEEQQLEYLYQTQRSFVKSFLSIINCEPDGTLRPKYIVDYWQKPEYIYLGPDENMHDCMIQWIAQESKQCGYKPGGAFISGKPEIGINHKGYGVTSMGVNVYMHEILLHLGIDPLSEPFTVKMTGGPDGDVAGNQILNLNRYYPETAKLLALTDISGTIFDPKGLNLNTLATLFYEQKPIRFYPQEQLNVGGFLLDREKRREPTPYVQQTLCWRNRDGNVEADWLSGNEMNALYRNNVHKTPADIFIPCGGRPRTIRDTNYQDLLDNTGAPTTRAIVEGANLYLTPWSRKLLENKGILIIKDSSANKGGVICSSFEILCGLTLSDKEFLDHKNVLVEEITDKLKACAENEAKLLITTHNETGKPLTEISDEISKRILYFTYQLLTYFNTIQLSNSLKDPLIQCFLSYCPHTLRHTFSGRLMSEVPENHKKAIIASHLASHLVYERGLNWFPTLVDILPILLRNSKLL
ncbi:MAG: NAD-specific glutamate dehydrogenase [Chlamydiae bacterium]|nr:NAD-specific glutamate dehydrogenase [Chlamydiota bacterium]